MARIPDPANRHSSREDERAAEEVTHPRPELRWMELRQPRHAVEIGRNGRILASRYHPGYDAWEVLLETYEGELSDSNE